MTDDPKESAERVALEMGLGFADVKLFEEFTPAFLGFATRGSGSEPVACYDYEKSLDCIERRNEWPREECVEFLEYNYINAWLGDGTPFFVRTVEADLDEGSGCPACSS